MASEKVANINELSFSEFTYSQVSVDSTTQGALFTGNAESAEIWVVTNPSTNKGLFAKPDDNTNNKRGILIPPRTSRTLIIRTSVIVYGIMDGGGSVAIEILRVF